MNIFPPAQKRLNPFAFYAEMRHKNPISFDDSNSVWGVFRYYDVLSILEDYSNFCFDPRIIINPPSSQRIGFMLRIISSVLSQALSLLETRIEEMTYQLINQVIEKRRMDLISDFAHPLSVAVIGKLLDIPREDYNMFQEWANKLIGLSEGGKQSNNDHYSSDKNLPQIQNKMNEYFNVIIGKRMETPRQDLVSSLIIAEADGEPLSREEILAYCKSFLLAGHVPTVSLIGNTVYSLLQNEQQYKQLLEGNQNALIPSVIEETLRYRSPVQAAFRIATHDVSIGGQKILAGQRVVVWLGSANHDESVFPHPERFDLSRNLDHSHLGFGHGIGYCPGAPLARLEARIALRIIFERLRNLELDNVDGNNVRIRPLPSLFLHGASCLPIRFKPLYN